MPQREPEPPPPGWLRALRLVSSTWLGLALLVPILVFLCIASVDPYYLMDLLDLDKDAIWGHWLLVGPCLAFVTVMTLATIVRIPLDLVSLGKWMFFLQAYDSRVALTLARLGAWISHAGLVMLTVASLYYVAHVERGQATTFRTPQGWTEVDSFYQEFQGAIYVRDQIDDKPRVVDLGPVIRRIQPMAMDVAVPAGQGLDIRVVEILPDAEVHSYWADDNPEPQPAVMLDVVDGRRQRLVLGPKVQSSYVATDFILTYRPNSTPAMVSKAASQPAPMDRPLVILFAGPDLPPTVVVTSAKDKPWQGPASMSEPFQVPVAGRQITLQIHQYLQNARLHTEAHQQQQEERREAEEWAAHLKVRAGDQEQDAYLSMQPFEHLAQPQVITAGGREILLTFSRPRKDLPGKFIVDKADYEAYPGSVVPKDYRCEVRVVEDARTEKKVLGLNEPVMVGPYQFTQFQWLPSATAARQIIFSVASRPALPVIWLGCWLICLGMPYAFYVKPLLLKWVISRQARQVAAGRGGAA